MKDIRVLLVDDHQMFRNALRSLLEKISYLQVVGETGNAFEVIKMVRATSANIVCMDIGMPGMNGIETTHQLLKICPWVKVIALSTYSDQRYVKDMLNAGASAYVTKFEASEELLRAIIAVRQNRRYLCPDVTDAVIGTMHVDVASKLTSRERQVLQLVAEGHTSAIIGEQLNIVRSTVEVHRRNIMRKLKLYNVAELVRYAINNGIIS
jgi:two-component system NarL family response regulator